MWRSPALSQESRLGSFRDWDICIERDTKLSIVAKNNPILKAWLGLLLTQR